MTKETLFTMNTAFRGEYNIYGYHYGMGDHEACIVGAMRGNEYQQLYLLTAQSEDGRAGGPGTDRAGEIHPDHPLPELQCHERQPQVLAVG